MKQKTIEYTGEIIRGVNIYYIKVKYITKTELSKT